MSSVAQKAALIKQCLDGFKVFEATGATPEQAYLAMRQLYVQTDGWFNDIFQLVYGMRHRRGAIPPLTASIFGTIDNGAIEDAVDAIKRDGYFVFPEKVPVSILESIYGYSLTIPASMEGEAYQNVENKGYFNEANPVAAIYRFSQEDTINHSVLQQIMADPVLLEIASRYFNSQASYCNVHMWWTTPYGCETPNPRLAQQYHFDMDRFKFLNFFLYVTDVGPEDGPHCFIRGSHRRKPVRFLQDRRFTDEEVAEHYSPEDHIEINGPRGTIMAVDGRGLHKAKMPTRGNRLMFLSSMSSSLFGQTYPRVDLKVKSDAMRAAVASDPRITCAYDVSEANEKVLASV
ncbi:MAG: phytanoyl-CoA dioxygenase family protein [Cyanobacteria bacterium HKST-UBA02]|nr:phytanoyl-CoA dioxygenase family protein [Cyanobacteria bacterium HKST-UBA02]